MPGLPASHAARVVFGDITNRGSLHNGNGEIKTAKRVPARSSCKRSRTQAIGILKGDANDVQCVSEYATEIVKRLLEDERRAIDYIGFQKDINARMRAILIDWLVEVHMKYKLRPETLYLTVSIADHYLEKVLISRSRLQLLGVVAMCIAAKHEEINPPVVNDYVYITDNAYTKQDVIGMECEILCVLDFKIVNPTSAHLLTPLLHVNGCSESHGSFVRYVCELALLDLSLRLAPSELVCAALLLSNKLEGRAPKWPAALQELTGRREQELRPLASKLHGLLEETPRTQLKAVRRKYQSGAHHHVARGWPLR